MEHIIAYSTKKGGYEFKIPVLDVRTSEEERKLVVKMNKSSNGNHSKFIPGKWGYSPNGPKKY